MMSDPDPVQVQSLVMMETDKSGSFDETDDSQDVNVIIDNLFDIGLEEVLQKIFLC